MTCIAALVDPRGGAVIGGDSCTADDWHHAYTADDQKVFRCGEFLIGVSGSWRTMHLIRYAFEPPAHPDGLSDHAYMLVVWMAALRAALRQHGALKTSDGVESLPESARVLVVYRRRVYQVCEDLQITTPGPYAAAGSGYAVALGRPARDRQQLRRVRPDRARPDGARGRRRAHDDRSRALRHPRRGPRLMRRRVIVCDGCGSELKHPDLPADWLHLTHRVAVGGLLVVEDGRALPKLEDRHYDFCGVECLAMWTERHRSSVCPSCLAVRGQHTPTCQLVQGNAARAG